MVYLILGSVTAVKHNELLVASERLFDWNCVRC